MLNVVEELGHWEDGEPQTIGHALLRAKQRYYNGLAADSFSNYDEKVLAITTLYGLPMLRVSMPQTTTASPSARTRAFELAANDVVTSELDLGLSYTAQTTDLGTYYIIDGETGTHAVAGRPVQPLTSQDIGVPGAIAHGALLVGGAFEEVTGFDPLVSRVVTDQLYVAGEAEFGVPVGGWYPARLATINRFLAIDGQSHDRLVVVPGQFRAVVETAPGSHTTGIERLYSTLSFEIYHAPITATDFAPPTIWTVDAVEVSEGVSFQVRAEDDSGMVERVVVLYRYGTERAWRKAELAYDASSGWAGATVAGSNAPVYYFAQAVDPTGNVSMALDRGLTFQGLEQRVYLPVALRSTN
jgi:hypothetical protein